MQNKPKKLEKRKTNKSIMKCNEQRNLSVAFLEKVKRIYYENLNLFDVNEKKKKKN